MSPHLKEIAELWKEYVQDCKDKYLSAYEEATSPVVEESPTIEGFLHFLTTKL